MFTFVYMKATKAIKKTLTSDSFYAIETMWLKVYAPSGWKIEQHLQYTWSWRRMKWQYKLVITFGEYNPIINTGTAITIMAIVSYTITAIVLSYFKASSDWWWAAGLMLGNFFGMGYGMDYEKRKHKKQNIC